MPHVDYFVCKAYHPSVIWWDLQRQDKLGLYANPVPKWEVGYIFGSLIQNSEFLFKVLLARSPLIEELFI